MERQALRWSQDVSALVHEKGAEPGAPLTGQLTDAIHAGRFRIGEPCTPLPVPESAAVPRVSELDETILKLQAENRLLRERIERWWADYERFRGTPVETRTEVSSPALRGLFAWPGIGLIGLIGLAILFPSGVAAVLLWLLRRSRLAIRQVAGAIEEFKLDGDPVQVKLLKTHLDGSMDTSSKLVVDRARRK